jgi:hypothetical protein
VSPKLLVFEILALLVFSALAGAGFLAWRLSQGPIDLELIRPRIERSLAEARGGEPVRIGSLALEWSKDRARVEAAARGLTALDKAGNIVSQAERAVITLDTAALLAGKVKTERLRMENGAAAVRRSREGVWTLAGVEILREPRSAEKPFDPLKDLNWPTLATPLRALVSAGSFERVELVNFKLDVSDEAAGTTWAANPVNGVWTADADGIALDLDARLVGAAEPNSITIALAANGEVTKATGRLVLEGVDPVTVAAMFGYAGDNFVSGKPANATFVVSASEAAGLETASLILSDVTGAGRFGGLDLAVQDLSFDAAYDPAAKQVALKSLNIRSDRLTGAFSGSLDVSSFLAGDAGKPVPVKLSGRDFTLSATPVFEAPWPFQSIDIEGAVQPDFQRFVIASLKGVTGGLNAEGSGEIWFDGPADNRRIGLKMKAHGEGAISPEQVVAFWPVNLSAEGRSWVKEHILAGKATKADFSVDWPPGANDGGFLPDEHLDLVFHVEDTSVMFLPDFPPVTGVSGVGHMKGNSLTIETTGGKLRAWDVDEGKVVLPRFAPKGAILEVTASGRGELRDMMRVLDQSDLKVGEKYGLRVEQMAGSGGVDVVVRSPMINEIPKGALKYEIKGGFLNAGAPDLAAGFGLVDSDVRFTVTETGLSIAGGGRFGPAPVVFDWRERFSEVEGGPSASELTATAKVTPDLLNAFGLAARTVMQGEAEVALRASGSGRDFSAITADVDLTKAALDISELGWTKNYDAPAKGQFRYSKDAKVARATGDIRSDGLELIGEARMDPAPGGKVQSATIEHIFARGAVDLHGDVTRRSDGGYRLALSGPFFDASPWMDSFLSMSESDAGAQAAPAQAQGPHDQAPPFEIALKAERLRLREDAELHKADVALVLDDQGPRQGRVAGATPEGKAIEVQLGMKGAARTASIRAEDAGFAARVLMKADYLLGGTLAMDATFDGPRGTAQLTMADVRLRNAPLLAQILSLASLRGLTDVLNGDGVLFTRVEAPLVLTQGRIELPGLRASGPAMGLTARGMIAPGSGDISLDGVLVPSFGMNSMLGGIPIIGDLFVSRQGEGTFAPTYSVRGNLARARVSINPVAAITPGVLRRIFENPAEAPENVRE